MIERDKEQNTCLVMRCENCGRLHVYKRERKDGECECWGMQSYMKTRHQM